MQIFSSPFNWTSLLHNFYLTLILYFLAFSKCVLGDDLLQIIGRLKGWALLQVPCALKINQRQAFIFSCTTHLLFYFILFIYLFLIFIYLYLFLSVLGLRFCVRAFSSCGKRGPLFIAVRRPLTITASLVAEHRLQTRRLSSCGSRAQSLRGMRDPPRPGLEPVSPALAGRLSTAAPPGKPHLLF